MENKKWLWGLVGLIVVGFGIFGITKIVNKPNKTHKDDEVKDETKLEEPPKKTKVEIIDVNSDSRPIGVMINNHKVAQPNQAGLNEAYIVYEMVVEGGITRMFALFKDANTDKIGTIRSARPYYLDYVMENDAIYAHFGGSDDAMKQISQLGINNVSGMRDSGFWRDEDLLSKKVPLEHTAYNKIENILKTASDWKYRLTSKQKNLLSYSVEDIDLSKLEGAIKADEVYVDYSAYQKNTFKYDSKNKVYNKYSGDELRVDYVTREPFTAKNIITYQVKNYSYDNAGHQKLENIGNGKGYFISNGYAVPITWEKESRSSQTVYKLLNGEELIVNDGITYIQIQPKNRELKIS